MKNTIYIILAVLFVGLVAWVIFAPGKLGKYDTFAQCIASKNVKFYGAFWCPHCQKQKQAFGKSAKYLPYIECSNPDGQSQKKECADAGITTYPTWQFGQSTSTRVLGEISLVDLASTTGCVLPQ